MERDYTHYNKQRKHASLAVREMLAGYTGIKPLHVDYSKQDDGEQIEITCKDVFFPTHIIIAAESIGLDVYIRASYGGGFVVRMYYNKL